MTFFTLRAETHTIMDQLWSVLISHPCPIPASHPAALDGTVALQELLGLLCLFLREAGCIRFFPGLPLEGLLYFHLDLGAISNDSYRVVSQWTTLVGAIRPYK